MSNCFDCRSLQSGLILFLDTCVQMEIKCPDSAVSWHHARAQEALALHRHSIPPSYTSQGSWIAQRKSTCTQNEHIWNGGFQPKDKLGSCREDSLESLCGAVPWVSPTARVSPVTILSLCLQANPSHPGSKSLLPRFQKKPKA